MKYETIPNLTLPKIGFGTWKIGGGSYADPKADSVSMTALHTALEVGYTHFDTAETYANGHARNCSGGQSANRASRANRYSSRPRSQPAI
jgi:aryl-alcohol dehydrogenase-like predicted oxidoreductase